jgi:hypothetical protein
VTTFVSEVFHNEYLPRGGTEVNAIISITASGSGAPVGTVEAAEVILVDVSGSMGHPPSKIREARNATSAAIECLRDGVKFAVVAGSHVATEVYPGDGALAVASDETRAAANLAVARMDAEGGTAIGRWLLAANELFATAPAAIRHAILLTDGKNEHEEPKDLARALERCAGNFTCDCRGIGADFSVEEVRGVGSALLGDVGMIRDPEGLVADFEAMMRSAMGKDTGDVALRVWVPQGVTIGFMKQVSGQVEDLAGHRTEVSQGTSEYATPAWGAETRDYHLCLQVPAREIGEEMLAGRISLVVGDDIVSEAKVLATWTEDDRPFTTRVPQLDHYTTEVRKSQLIDAGMDALDRDDRETATKRLREAVEMALETDDEERLALIGKVADVDRASGTVEIKDSVSLLDRNEVQIHSQKTRPAKKR